MAALPRDSLAMTSSWMIGKTLLLQPRMSVWSVSSTRERPLRSSSTLASNAPETMPMRLATMMRPPTVTTSIRMRKSQPSSAPMVPGSRVRMRLPQKMSQTLSASLTAGAPFSRVTSRTMTVMVPSSATNTTVAMPSRAMRAAVPFDIQPSNQ